MKKVSYSTTYKIVGEDENGRVVEGESANNCEWIAAVMVIYNGDKITSKDQLVPRENWVRQYRYSDGKEIYQEGSYDLAIEKRKNQK